jgi:predicted house-cleaning noncanonical NTP pyrophosphatase (MazG superfamily)
MIIHTDPNTLIQHKPKEAIVQEHESSFKEMLNPPATPVFDFTATINAALAQAIALATAPLVERIKYLENHSAAADNTFTLAQRIELLERSLVVADKAAQGNESDLISRVALLEDKLDNIKDASDERIQEIADDAARMVLSEHTEEYDHDGYDRLEDKLDDKVNEAIDDLDMEDKLRDTLRNMTFSITARY